MQRSPVGDVVVVSGRHPQRRSEGLHHSNEVNLAARSAITSSFVNRLPTHVMVGVEERLS
jgi:hypothetical protein